MKIEEIEKKGKTISEEIQNRNSIIKAIVILLFTALIGYKLFISDIIFDFSQFDFSDLLTLILAIFSIGLSVVFYFKATDTSNLFYDNTYRFTKDISEILGRIEAGFGERLRHLDEGYSGLRDKFDGKGMIKHVAEIDNAKQELDEDKVKLEAQIKEKEQLLHELMNKAKLSAKEREIFTAKIKEKDEEIESLSGELNMFKRNIFERERTLNNELFRSIPPDVSESLMNYVKKNVDLKVLLEAPLSILARKIRIDLDHFSSTEKNKMIRYGLANPDGSLTRMGVELIRGIARRTI